MDESNDKTLMRRVLMVITVPLVALVTWTILSSFSNVWELSNMESIMVAEQRASQDEGADNSSAQKSAGQASAENQAMWETLPARSVGLGQEGIVELPPALGSGAIGLTVNDARVYEDISAFAAGENVDAQAFLDSLPQAVLLERTREQIEGSPVVALDVSVRNVDASFSGSDGTAARLAVPVILLEGQKAQAAGEVLSSNEEMTVDIQQGESSSLRLYYTLSDGVDTGSLNACVANDFDTDGMNEVVLFNLGL